MGTRKPAVDARTAVATDIPVAVRRSRERARKLNNALRALGKVKGRDTKLWIDAIAPGKASGPAGKPSPGTSTPPGYGFLASLPVRTTEDARMRIGQLKAEGIVRIKLPADLCDGGKVIGVNAAGKASVVGLLSTRRPEVETDPEKAGIQDAGLLVRLKPASRRLLEFVVRVPALPKAVRSRTSLDQGGLRRSLALFAPVGPAE